MFFSLRVLHRCRFLTVVVGQNFWWLSIGHISGCIALHQRKSLSPCCQWMAAAEPRGFTSDAIGRDRLGRLSAVSVSTKWFQPQTGRQVICIRMWRCHWAAANIKPWNFLEIILKTYGKRTKHCRDFRCTENLKLSVKNQQEIRIAFLPDASSSIPCASISGKKTTPQLIKVVISTWFSAKFFFN